MRDLTSALLMHNLSPYMVVLGDSFDCVCAVLITGDAN